MVEGQGFYVVGWGFGGSVLGEGLVGAGCRVAMLYIVGWWFVRGEFPVFGGGCTAFCPFLIFSPFSVKLVWGCGWLG